MSLTRSCIALLQLGLVLTLWVFGPALGRAQAPAPDTLRLAEAVRLARQQNPALRAARYQAAAGAERVAQAGARPDPMLTLGLMNRPLSDFGTAEPMTMNQVSLSQELPWPGKLGFSRQRAEHLAQASALDAEEADAQLVAGITATYYEVAYMDRALVIMARTRDLLREFFQVSRSRYATGEGLQQDLLQAQVSVARMTEDITVMQQDRQAMAARLNALLGRDAPAPVGALELPSAGDSLPTADSLIVIATQHRPAIAAAAARVEAARAGYRAARRELYPNLMVSVSYGQRPQFDDMATVMVGVSLPIWAGQRQLPFRREMAAMQADEEAAAQNLYNETFAQLTEHRADAERARVLAHLYQTSIVPQAEAAVESALSAYRVGRVDFLTLVQNEMTVNRYEIEAVRLAASWQQAVARIQALLGSEGGIQ